MEITLKQGISVRKGLEKLITEYVPPLSLAMQTLDITDIAPSYERGRLEFSGRVNTYHALVTTNINLRHLLADANHRAGIDARMTEIKGLETMILFVQRCTPVRATTKSQVQDEFNEHRRSSKAGFAFTPVDQEMYDRLLTEKRKMARRLDELRRDVKARNLANWITIQKPDEDVLLHHHLVGAKI